MGSICTEAGMFAIRARKKAISEKDFLKAIEKIKYDSRFSATEKYKVYNWLHKININFQLFS